MSISINNFMVMLGMVKTIKIHPIFSLKLYKMVCKIKYGEDTSHGQPAAHAGHNLAPGGLSHGPAVVIGVSGVTNGVPAVVEVQRKPIEISL